MYEGRTCSKLGPLSERQRDRLPDKAFGIPAQRKYPMPDPAHAANAKGRAKTAKQRGELTAKQYDAIVRKADRVIERCNGTAGLRGTARTKDPAWAPWAVFALAGIGWMGIVYLMSSRRQP